MSDTIIPATADNVEGRSDFHTVGQVILHGHVPGVTGNSMQFHSKEDDTKGYRE
jgi:hypothetical protein